MEVIGYKEIRNELTRIRNRIRNRPDELTRIRNRLDELTRIMTRIRNRLDELTRIRNRLVSTSEVNARHCYVNVYKLTIYY